MRYSGDLLAAANSAKFRPQLSVEPTTGSLAPATKKSDPATTLHPFARVGLPLEIPSGQRPNRRAEFPVLLRLRRRCHTPLAKDEQEDAKSGGIYAPQLELTARHRCRHLRVCADVGMVLSLMLEARLAWVVGLAADAAECAWCDAVINVIRIF